MAVAFRAAGAWSFSANNVASPTNLTPGAPAGTQVGDGLILIAECRSISATCATPSGWTLLSGFPKASATTSGGKIYIFVRTADGTSADTPTVTWSGMLTGTSGDANGAGILAYSGLDVTTLDGTVQVSDLSAQTTTSTVPGITTSVNGSLTLTVYMKLREASSNTSTITNFTERADNSTTSGTGHTIAVADKILATAGASGTGTVTWAVTTSSQVLAVTIGIAAVATGGSQAITPAGVSATSSVSGAIVAKRSVVPAGISATSTVGGTVSGGSAQIFATAGYETGVAGNTVSTADAGNATPITSNATGGTSTLTYDTVPLTVGSLSCKHGSAAGSSFWQWNNTVIGTKTQMYLRGYFMSDALTTSILPNLFRGFSDSTLGFSVDMVGQSSGGSKIRIRNGSTTVATSTTVISADQIVRVEAFWDQPNGAITVRLFVGSNSEGSTPDETVSATGLTIPVASVNTLDVGPATSSTFNMWSDAIAIATGNWIGPAGSGSKAITPGAISATSTVSGAIIKAPKVLVLAAISATSTLTGRVAVRHKIAPAQISAASVVAGSFKATRPVIPASIAATSTVVGRISGPKRFTGAIAATSIVSVTLRAIRRITPTSILATSIVSAGLRVVRRIVTGAISATSTVVGAVGRIKQIAPTSIAANSTLASSINVGRAIRATTINAVSTVASTITATRRIAPSSILATSTFSGQVLKLRPVTTAVISATSSVTGAIRVIRRLTTAAVTASSSVAGAVVAKRRVSGAIAATSTVVGNVAGRPKIVASAISATSVVTGSLHVIRRLVISSVLATSSVAGSISAQRKIAPAQITATSVVSASLRVQRGILATSINATSTVTGDIHAIRVFVGNIDASSTVAGALSFVRPVVLDTNIFATSTVSGNLSVRSPGGTEYYPSMGTTTKAKAGRVEFVSHGTTRKAKTGRIVVEA